MYRFMHLLTLKLLRWVVLGAALAVATQFLNGGAAAHLNRSDMDGYSYDAGDEGCVDPGNWKDPITVAFVYGATDAVVDHHARDHGYTYGDDDDEQRFYDHGQCGFEDVDLADDGEGFPPSDRWHMRAHTALDPGGGWDEDPEWGVYSVATPHRDQATFDIDCWGESGHLVPENYNGVSGFVAGREDVLERWVTNGDHYIAAWDVWWNTAAIMQCDDENEPASDGWVAYVAMGDTDGDGVGDEDEISVYGTDPLNPDTDGDGCKEGQEIEIGFQPLNPWDVYDVPVPAVADPTPNGERNGKIDMGDVLAVLFYVYARDNREPNGNGVDYDSWKDGDWTGSAYMYADGYVDSWDEVGRRYDRSAGDPPTPQGFDPAGPPSTVVDMGDVLATLAQAFAIDCTADIEDGADGPDSEAGREGATFSAANTLAVDAVPGGAVDSARTVKGVGSFDVDIAITTAKSQYSGYQFVLSYDDRVLALLPTTDVDRDGTLESWTYTRLDGATLDAEVARRDLDRDSVVDSAAGGTALLSGATSATGVIATVRFQCVGNGTSPIHLVAPGEASFDTTTFAPGGAPIDTGLTDAWITCSAD